MFKTMAQQTKKVLETGLKAQKKPTLREVSVIQSLSSGTAEVTGLSGVGLNELVMFKENVLGMVHTLSPTHVGVVFLTPPTPLKAGDKAHRTGRILDVPVGSGVLGRVINPLGEPLDGLGGVPGNKRLPVERPAVAIMDRAPVQAPLQTGLKVIDAFTPIGRGQRELILGDRQTGKTAIALDTMLNQAGTDVICIYCAIGQRASSTAHVIETLKKSGVFEQSVVVVADGKDEAGLQYIAPYAATSIGEYFMEQGKDVLVIYDDLTAHARAYRQLSLLLKTPPGREAYPGDIFYLHARLLERATHLNAKLGGGSLTALPIVSTEAGNISAYIPTNIISITDGQIYLSTPLFQKGQFPAVDTGRSVSRVGGDAQIPAYRSLVGALKLFYAQFEELESFAKFGTTLDEATTKQLKRGQVIRAIMAQPQYEPMPVADQIAVWVAVEEGVLDDVPETDISKAQYIILKTFHQKFLRTAKAWEDKKEKLTAGVREKLVNAFQNALEKEMK